MHKEIIIKNLAFHFSYRTDDGFWYLGKNEFDMFNLGYSSDITLHELSPNWDNVVNFLHFLVDDLEKFAIKINTSNIKLKEFFKNRYYSIAPSLDFEAIFFTLCNIDYKYSKVENEREKFEYVLNFNVESKVDESFFTYDSWNAHFIDDLLLDVYQS